MMTKLLQRSSTLLLLLLLIMTMSTSLAQGEQEVTVVEQDLSSQLAEQIEPYLSQGQFGIYIKSLTDGQVLYQQNSEEPLIPASNEKLVTTIGAYYLVGPDYRYRTEFYLEPGAVNVDEYYFGNIAIKGYGDPMFRYTTLIDLLKKSPLMNSKQFRGHLYIDDTYFDNQRFGSDWTYEFAKEIGAIIFRDSSLAKFGDAPDTVPKNIGRTVNMIFRALKIQQKGKIYAGMAMPKGMELVNYYESAPLIEIMGYCNKPSDNSIAEQIFKTVSGVTLGEGSFEGSQKVLKEFYQEKIGLDPDRYLLNDGSGLSHSNRISTYYLAQMMEYALYHPNADEEVAPEIGLQLALQGEHPYLNTLAITGQEGTLEHRMTDTTFYGKTGTLDGVDALSGYVITASGKVVILSILVNNFTIARHDLRALEDRLVELIYSYY